MRFIHKSKVLFGLSLMTLVTFQACNKEFEGTPVGPQPPAPGTGSTLEEIINTDTSFSFLKRALGVAGTSVSSVLGNRSANVTLFAPDNEAFRRSGIPSAAVFGSPLLDSNTTRSLLRYLILPDAMGSQEFSTDFPNTQLPSFLNPAPQLSPLLRLTAFPSRRGSQAYINNIPVVGTDITAANGVLLRTAALPAPPTRTLYDLIVNDTTLDYLEAAIIRADSGRTTIADQSIIEITKSIGANLTVFAPTDNAFRMFMNARGLPADSSFIQFLPVNTVRGLIAYHVLTSRAFSVNMPTTPTLKPTFLNTQVQAHPGVLITAGFTGPFVTAFTVQGVGNATASNVLVKDIHAVNGVIHKIDQLLLPQ